MDKAFWQAVVDADYALPTGYSVGQLTPELLGFLGSADVEVRDPFGYTILAQWMIRDGHYAPEDLRAMRDQLLLNLQAGLGENGTDRVFLRSFSMVILSLIVYRDNQIDFFRADEVRTLLEHTLRYFAEEKDLRGFVPNKGWAHSCAHTADMFKFLGRSLKTQTSDLERILDSITNKLTLLGDYVYIHSEDERLVSAVIEVLKRGVLSADVWMVWLERFALWKQITTFGDFSVNVHAPWLNCKNFLRSLYFRLTLTPDLPAPAESLGLKTLDIIKNFGL